MNIKVLALPVLLVAALFTACDSDTLDIGQSLTDNSDKLNISTDTFNILGSRTIVADSVLANSVTGYLGRVRDPETGALTTADFMSQYRIQDNYKLPALDSIVSKTAEGAYADSCLLQLNFYGYFGYSLSQMKMTAYELDHPLEENHNYYTNFDIQKEGYLRTNGLSQSRSFTLADLSSASSTGAKGTRFQNNIIVRLNKPYTDKEGKKYNNYGTYIMRMYYRHPEYFRNSYTFTKYVCPGFYFKTTGGEGVMAYVNMSNMYVYFRFQENDTTVSNGQMMMAGTEEVLQTTHIINDVEKMKELAADNKCTYVKSPAGLFTELTLPVSEIVSGHENDSLNSVKLRIPRIVNTVGSKYSLNVPGYLLMIPKSKLKKFFEDGDLPDNKTSYITSFGGTNRNEYVFNNISSLITSLYQNRANGGEDWNKVVLIPVTPTYTTRTSSSGTTTQVLTKLVHNLSMSSTRLVGGSENPNEKLTVSVVYSKFNR